MAFGDTELTARLSWKEKVCGLSFILALSIAHLLFRTKLNTVKLPLLGVLLLLMLNDPALNYSQLLSFLLILYTYDICNNTKEKHSISIQVLGLSFVCLS
jgi:hypothetical protein